MSKKSNMDLNSRIEAAQKQAQTLKVQIAEIQSTKRDKTLSAAAASLTPTKVRTPPSVKLRRTLRGHFGKVTAFHWSNDSRQLVSASQDGNLLLWNAATNHKIQSIALKSSYVMAVGIDQQQGQFVACGGLDNLCTVYPRSNPDKAVEMASHDGFLSCCRFLSDSTEILTSSGDSTCIRWDIEAAKPISTFTEHTADAMFLALKDRNVFSSCSVDKSTKLWDIRTPDRSIQTFRGHVADINAVEFMPSDPNVFATCGQDNTVRLFDVRAYNELSCFGTMTMPSEDEAVPSDGMTSLSFSKSGRLVFTGHSDGTVSAFDVLSQSKEPAFTIQQAHDRHVSMVAVSPSGDALCTSSWDSVLKIWA